MATKLKKAIKRTKVAAEGKGGTGRVQSAAAPKSTVRAPVAGSKAAKEMAALAKLAYAWPIA